MGSLLIACSVFQQADYDLRSEPTCQELLYRALFFATLAPFESLHPNVVVNKAYLRNCMVGCERHLYAREAYR